MAGDSIQVPGLRRSLTLTHAVLYGLGVTIGAGIYVLVGVAAGRSGMNAPLAFGVAAIVMAFTAATFAELGTRMPVSASEAAYVDAAFGKQCFTIAVGLSVVMTAMVSAATVSVGGAGYVAVLLSRAPDQFLVAGIILAMGAVASLATAQSVAFAGLMTVIELAGLVLIVLAGALFRDDLVLRLPEMLPSITDTGALIGLGGTALIAVFAFIGFEHLVNIAEEMKNPRTTLPRALFLTLGLTALFYAAVVWIAVVTVPPAELAASPAPLATVFQRLTGLPLVTMSAIAVVATLNGVIVHMIMIARVLYGMAGQGNLPKMLAHLNRTTATPLLANIIGVSAILALALFIPLEGLAELTSRMTLGVFVIVNAALINIKRREKMPPDGTFICPPWVPYAGLASSLGLLVVDLVPD